MTFKPTDDQRQAVERMTGILTTNEICYVMGIDYKTLKKYFGAELEHGKAKVKKFVVGKLLKNIQKEKEASIFFYLKTQCGWKETKEDTTPVEIFVNVVDKSAKKKA